MSVIVPVVVCPEATLVGLKESAEATGRITVRSAINELPPTNVSVAVISESVLADCGKVSMVKLPVVALAVGLAGILMLATDTVAAFVLLLDKFTITPLAGAGPERVTVPVTVPDAQAQPVTVLGLKSNPAIAGGITVSVNVASRLEPELAATITFVDAATGLVVTVNVAVVLFAGTVTPLRPPETGGTTIPGGEVVRETKTPPGGAVSLIVTVPVEVVPPVTFSGLKLNWTTGGGSTIKFTATMTAPVEAVTVTGVGTLTAPATVVNV